MSELYQGPEASDFTEVERLFFEAAPPEIAVAPPPPPSFDDLDASEGPRPARLAGSPSRRSKRASRRAAASVSPPGRLSRVGRHLRALVAPATRRLEPGARRAWSWTSARAIEQARRFAPSARVARERATRAFGAIVARVAKDLPEAPDGKSIAAAVAALVVVLGLSASVLGSRSNPRRSFVEAPVFIVAEPPSAPALAPPAEPEPVVAIATTPSTTAKHARATRRPTASAPRAIAATPKPVVAAPAPKPVVAAPKPAAPALAPNPVVAAPAPKPAVPALAPKPAAPAPSFPPAYARKR